MSDHGSPTQVRPGIVVRIRVAGSYPYTSVPMTLAKATELVDSLVARFRTFPEGLLDVSEFPSADLQRLVVHVPRVIAVEVRCIRGDGVLQPAASDLDEDPS